jgi:hypothetical protein
VIVCALAAFGGERVENGRFRLFKVRKIEERVSVASSSFEVLTLAPASSTVALKGSRKNNFTFWRESRWSIMTRFLFAKHAEDHAPSGCGPQARWLCCSLLTYRTGYASSLAPR